jgi:hypothetical protein
MRFGPATYDGSWIAQFNGRGTQLFVHCDRSNGGLETIETTELEMYAADPFDQHLLDSTFRMQFQGKITQEFFEIFFLLRQAKRQVPQRQGTRQQAVLE